MCETCTLARAEKISPRKHRLYDDNVSRPFEVISTDIKGPLMESRSGMKYSVVFIDQFSRVEDVIRGMLGGVYLPH